MKIGWGFSVDDVDGGIARLKNYGFESTQVGCGNGENLTEELAKEIAHKVKEAGLVISSVWPGYTSDKPMQWAYSRTSRPTVGLVPPETRQYRLDCFKRASDFAHWMGAPAIAQHVGYIPEDPSDELYDGVIECLTELADYCWANGEQWFLFETGQETPITLLRTIQDVGRPNLGVNLDSANCILYGKANPVDALDMLGPYVRDVHAKDGFYPTGGYALGEMVPLGEGKVDFKAFINRLKDFNYDGSITIECELRGDKEKAVRDAKKLLDDLI